MVAQLDKGMVRRRPLKAFGRLFAWAFVEGRPLTTSGRWINPLVFASFSVSKHIPARRKADEPIYIIGTGRSGTTIFGKLFAMHRDVVFLNEPKAVWHYVQEDEDLAGNYTLGDARVRLDETDARPEQAKTIARIYSNAMRAAFASRVVDKYPELIFRLAFVRELFPKASFIAIQRNGVQTCASISRWSKNESKSRRGSREDWWGLDGRKWRLIVDQIVPEHEDLAKLQPKLKKVTNDYDRAAIEWILSSRELRSFKSKKDVFVVKYEHLCEDSDKVLSKILHHVGLRSDRKFMEYARQSLRVANKHPSIELMRELVEPFCSELIASGYPDGVASVSARAD